MREDYGSLPMNMHDDGFGEIGFDTPDLVRDGLNPTIDVSFPNSLKNSRNYDKLALCSIEMCPPIPNIL